jgi:hypothetical protein
MRTLTSMVFIIAALAGCATTSTPAPYGNFIQRMQGAGTADEGTMADDVARKLASTYPPARTRFTLQQATPDAFGSLLVAQLRKKGYAMAEFRQNSSDGGPRTKAAATNDLPVDLALAYIVDQPLEEPLYRVTIVVDSQTLSRLYSAKAGTLSPAGAWIRKE